MIEKKTRINLGTSPEKSINGLERRKLKRKRFGKHRQERVAEEKLLFVFFLLVLSHIWGFKKFSQIM